MAKTNFGKVEERLVTGLRKMFIAKLLEIADTASRSGAEQEIPLDPETGEARAATTNPAKSRQTAMAAVADRLRNLKGDEEPEDSEDDEDRVEAISRHTALVDDPSQMSVEDWEKMKDLKGDIEAHAGELSESVEGDNVNVDQVEAERTAHVYKRYNVRKNWIPMDLHVPPFRKERKKGQW